MPEISRFFGIIIAMYYNDHAPPHFHVRYGEQKAIVAIDPMNILEGKLSRRVWGLVKEWGDLHREELQSDWVRARAEQELHPIPPLE